MHSLNIATRLPFRLVISHFPRHIYLISLWYISFLFLHNIYILRSSNPAVILTFVCFMTFPRSSLFVLIYTPRFDGFPFFLKRRIMFVLSSKSDPSGVYFSLFFPFTFTCLFFSFLSITLIGFCSNVFFPLSFLTFLLKIKTRMIVGFRVFLFFFQIVIKRKKGCSADD